MESQYIITINGITITSCVSFYTIETVYGEEQVDL